jgi:hypothetical protein
MLRPLPLDPTQVVAVRQVPQPLRSPPEEVMSVNVSIPLIALVAIVAYITYRHMGLRAWHAIICSLFGFLLAATGAAPQIHSVLAAILQWLQSSGSR